MGAEGFHYCFKQYSSFEEVEDEQFHKLRKQYLEAADMLEKYVGIKIDELSDKLLEDEE
jgi:thymidylate kinase